MGKKKKTLKQKKLAEQRRLTESHGTTHPQETPHVSQPSTTFSYTFSKTKQTVRTPAYSLQHDLRKTFFVSLGILLFLVVFSALLHKYALMLPLVSLSY